MDEESFRRKEDRDWQTNVDHQLVTLMTGLQVIQDQIKAIFKQQREDAITLTGNRDEDGLIKRMKDAESAMRRIEAVLFMDSTGKRGLVKDVEKLYAGESKADRLWTNGTKIVVALIMSGLLIQNWTVLSRLFHGKGFSHASATVTKKAGNKRKKHVREAPVESDDGATEEEVSE